MEEIEILKKKVAQLERRITKVEKFLESLNFSKYSPAPSIEDNGQLYDQAVRIVCAYDKASSSLLQRRLSIGFNSAARLIEQLEETGVVGPADGAKPRDVLIKDPEKFLRSQKHN